MSQLTNCTDATSSSPTQSALPTFIGGRIGNSTHIVYLGHRYGKDKKPTVHGRQAWRCVKRSIKCPGRIYTLVTTNAMVGEVREHNHPANFIDCEVKEIYCRAKDMRTATVTPPSVILSSVKRAASSAALLHLPQSDNFKRVLNRTRQKEGHAPTTPTSLDEIQLESSTIHSFDGEPMLVYDNGDSQDRVIILGTDRCLRLLKRCPSWYVDCTFSCCPHLFYQLLVVMGELPDHSGRKPWIFPCVYILLTNKTQELYLEAFNKLYEVLESYSPDVIMVDFGRGLRNALSQTFPSVSIDGCAFHFAQAVIRWLNENGLKNAYNHSSKDPQTQNIRPTQPVQLWVRRFLNLAFVPTEHVTPAFLELLDLMPHDTGLNEFVNYFMTTWVQGITTTRGTRPARYPQASCNQVERTIASLNKTNNYMEAFNWKFSSMVGPVKPNIWSFLNTLYMEKQTTDEMMLRERVGDPPTATKRPRQASKDRRILALVELVHGGNPSRWLPRQYSWCCRRWVMFCICYKF